MHLLGIIFSSGLIYIWCSSDGVYAFDYIVLPMLIIMKKHVAQYDSVVPLCVFNNSGATTELYGTEE